MSQQPQDNLKAIEQVCVRLLHRREHSAQELKYKLMQRGYAVDEIEQVLSLLQQRKWQSDQRFLESYIHGRVMRGFGKARILAELQQKGIKSAEANEVFDACEYDWFELAEQAYRRKYNKPVLDIKEQQKRMRAMLQKGFDMEQIKPLFAIDFSDEWL